MYSLLGSWNAKGERGGLRYEGIAQHAVPLTAYIIHIRSRCPRIRVLGNRHDSDDSIWDLPIPFYVVEALG